MQFTSAAPVVEEQKRMKAKVCVCVGGGHVVKGVL